MTQVFADDDQVAERGMFAAPGRVPRQAALPAPMLGPALTPGKGVRRVRCVGCADDTLPRPADDAPLCHRCSELLATGAPAPSAWTGSWTSSQTLFRPPRWLRRRYLP